MTDMQTYKGVKATKIPEGDINEAIDVEKALPQLALVEIEFHEGDANDKCWIIKLHLKSGSMRWIELPAEMTVKQVEEYAKPITSGMQLYAYNNSMGK